VGSTCDVPAGTACAQQQTAAADMTLPPVNDVQSVILPCAMCVYTGVSDQVHCA
jgi:hypothetical protein